MPRLASLAFAALLLGAAGPPPQPDASLRPVPPAIRQLLDHPGIDPAVRAYLLGIAAKPTQDWTLQDLQTLTAVVPALTELRIPTATLSAFYDALGLDPAELFEPQLGAGWQSTSTRFDPRRRLQSRRCTALSREAQNDPASVRIQALLTCDEPD